MAGLDSIKHYEAGKSVTGDETSTEDAVAGALSAAGKTQTSKDKFVSSLPASGNTGLISAELLQNLQDMIKERESRRNSFMENLKDANAWWSGGVAGPGEALRARAAEREGQDASTFGMKSQLAQYKAAQAAAANQATSLRGTLSPTGGVPAGGAPTGGGAPPMPAAVAQEIDRLLSLNPPDVAGAQALRTKYVGNESKFDAARNTQGTYFINGKNVNMTPGEYQIYTQTGKMPGGSSAPVETPTSQALPHTKPIEKVSAPTGTPVQATAPTAGGVNANNVGNVRPVGSSTGFQQPKDMSEGLQIMDNNLKAYGDKGINTLEGIISRWAPPSENDTAAYIKSAAQRLGIDPKQPIDLSNPAVRQAVGTAIMLQEKGPKGIFNASTANVSLPQQKAALATSEEAPKAALMSNQANLPYPKPANSDEVKANQEYIKQRGTKELDIASKGPEKASTEAGARRAKMFELADATDQTVKAADMAIAASTNHPEATGIGKGDTAANKLVTFAGAVIPKMDKAKAEDIYSSFQKEGTIKAREAIVGSSKQLGIDFAANVFKGARMGIGLENMAANAKNVSEYNTAETNIINAKIIKEAALFNRARAELYAEWAPKNGGTMADFEKFETSPEYKALAKATQDKIAAQLPKYLKVGKDGLEQTEEGKKVAAPSGSENSARAELERRKKAKEKQ
jgi:hypothetical protein